MRPNHNIDRFRRYLEEGQPNTLEEAATLLGRFREAYPKQFVISEEAMAQIRERFPEMAHRFTTLPEE